MGQRTLGRPLLRVRVAAALGLVAVFFILLREGLLPAESSFMLILLCGVEILTLSIYHYVDRRARKEVFQAYWRWVTDTFLITVALYYLGGQQAFLFSFAYCFVILSASVSSRRMDSFIIATIATICYAALLYLEDRGAINPPDVWDTRLRVREQWLFLLWCVAFFYLTAFFSSLFSQKLMRRGRTLEIVNAISRISSSSLALGEVLGRTLDFVLVHLKADAGIVQLASPWDGMRLSEKEICRFPEDLGQSEEMLLGRLVRVLSEEDLPIVVRDLGSDPRTIHLGVPWTGAMMAAPIVHKGDRVGVFALFSRKRKSPAVSRRFRQADLDLMILITHQIAPAIVNARLFANLEDANRNIRRAQDEIVKREKLEALGEMIAGMAHQFRNPLLAIGAAAKRMAKSDRVPDGIRFYVQIIQKEAEKLEKILKDVPGFHVGTECHRTEVDINALVERALSVVFGNGARRGIVIERNFGEMKDPLPSADPDQLEVALYNIFSNAREAMGSAGTLKVSTRLESGSQGRVLMIGVSDTGGGISAEEVENIFNPFYTTKHWGSGLGLTMTHRIVENHGGDIRVLNRPGEGVTIQISIPNA